MIVTAADMENAKTIKGGYTKRQISIGNEITNRSKGWKKSLIGKNIEDRIWLRFVKAGIKGTKEKRKHELINKMSPKDGWAWKPDSSDIPALKVKSKKGKANGKRKAIREKVTKQNNAEFYASREWRELRVRVLEKYECKCMMCGRSPKIHGIVVHVDHIKSRSKYPGLSLTFENLQILCEDCNLGKSNKFGTDWRPIEWDEVEILMDSPF